MKYPVYTFSMSMFNRDPDDTVSEATLISYVTYVSRLLMAGLVKEQHHPMYELCTVDFLRLVCCEPSVLL